MVQRRLPVAGQYYPAYVVWELTLRCDQPCAHCGSRAGGQRSDELTTAEALALVEQLAQMGTQEVVLIGGEAYLHSGFLEIIQALAQAKIRPTMTTGGRGITAELAAAMAQAGLHSVSVSVDGLQVAHDTIRKAPGSYRSATQALQLLKNAGLAIAANTNVNRVNQADLEALYEYLQKIGIRAWQVQLTVPLGRAADRPQMILQPWELLSLVPRVAALKKRAYQDQVLLMPGNNLGYFGVSEALLRSVKPNGTDHFSGCQAGRRVMGIESNGGVKGCPSLQAVYVGGNIRQQKLADIWNHTAPLSFTRSRGLEDLWGYCRDCVFAEVCGGGCSFTAHALFGRPGNNPYCHYRATELAQRGLRERLVPTAPALGLPFDHGAYTLVTEPLTAPEPPLQSAQALVKITRRAKSGAS